MIKNESGYVALISVLIILAVGLIIGIGIGLNGMNELSLAYQNQQTVKAFNLADACADEALLNLKNDGAAYTGTQTLYFNDDFCTITISGIGNSRTADIMGTVRDKYIRKITLTVNILPSFSLENWEEVAEF